MKLIHLLYLNRHDRRIILVLLTVCAVALVVFFLAGKYDVTDEEEASQTAMADSLSSSGNAQASRRQFNGESSSPSGSYYAQPSRKEERFPFDPNTADSTQLLRLGLKPWQVRNIYKYRAAGGVYSRKEDFARLYGLTAKQYKELAPYIKISADYQPAALLVDDDKPALRDTLRFPVKITDDETIDINANDTATYKKVPGIGSYFARKIADYGRRLGGFVSIDQLDEIEGFPADSKRYFSLSASTGVRRMNVNSLTVNELKRHPYINYYQARAIVDYRRLHGPLKSLRDLSLLPDFPEEALHRLEPYVCYE